MKKQKLTMNNYMKTTMKTTLTTTTMVYKRTISLLMTQKMKTTTHLNLLSLTKKYMLKTTKKILILSKTLTFHSKRRMQSQCKIKEHTISPSIPTKYFQKMMMQHQT